jgi:hypothetical protein
MTFESWADEIERSGWSFGLSTQKQMLADWRTDRAEWRAALKEARQEIVRLKESANSRPALVITAECYLVEKKAL